MATTWSDDVDIALRREAMAWLALRTNDGLDALTTEEIKEFRFRGQPMPLMDPQRGIRKPAVLDAALSFRTVYRPEGADRPYEDSRGEDGLIRYKYRGTDAQHPENRALRAAMDQRLPLIWFFGVAPGVYHAAFPVFIVGEHEAGLEFLVDAVAGGALQPDSQLEDMLKRYVTVETRRRLHQPIFRAAVMHAYGTRCAVCALGHSPLLDAAHLVPDRDEAGVAAVRNGLALCKIHHAALDSYILGIRPDLVVQIREDLLHEIDGPMLKHGLQDLHGGRLMVVPSARRDRPDKDLLEAAYERFHAAG
ncbi:HNH endonuclease [Knoellia subterranea]|uniref:HNH nuclease domain-containing protein n=1 Tax=Knoellia subterranea KCTC 19937 TaxID=1385521 RepID=A0A0A0JHX3_9MICO|nr:HNH endonuclease [Knoellia subterranea]KGN36349.1 hypothetical protein N803_05965 [Knoellia subterranea KCTC 19937]